MADYKAKKNNYSVAKTATYLNAKCFLPLKKYKKSAKMYQFRTKLLNWYIWLVKLVLQIPLPQLPPDLSQVLNSSLSCPISPPSTQIID